MRIGIDASCWLNRRGFGRYARELVRALLRVDREHEYVLFLDADTARRSEALPPEDRAARVVVPTSIAAAQAASADGRRSAGDLWRMRRAVAAWGNRLDVFHFPAVYTYFPVRTPARVVVTKHDMTDRRCPELLFPTWRSRFFWEAKVRLAMRRADLVFTVSESSRRDILAAFRMAPDRVRVVADAVDAGFAPVADGAERRAVLARYGLAAGRRFVLYVGGISPHKNIETLLSAYQLWREDPASAGADVQLVLVGDFAADVFYSSYPSIQRLIRDARIEDDVRFTGYVPDADLVHLYSAADALVLPSFSEGFGLPALEAMACGAPTVVADAGALPEVVGDAGILFDPRSAEALAAALGPVLADARLRADLASRGRARATAFTWEASARAALAGFAELAR
jgi:glycosyltransferase involved in cell wall biosynthesis